MLVTLAGIVIDGKLSQRENAFSPIVSTPSDMMTDVRFKQLQNAYSLIFFTLVGMVMDIRDVQSEKADLPMLVTVYVVPSLFVTVVGMSKSLS
jgi:hypothetical protein